MACIAEHETLLYFNLLALNPHLLGTLPTYYTRYQRIHKWP